MTVQVLNCYSCGYSGNIETFKFYEGKPICNNCQINKLNGIEHKAKTIRTGIAQIPTGFLFCEICQSKFCTNEEHIKIARIPKAKTDKVGTGLILIPLYSLLALGKIFLEGLRYGKDNWKKGINDKEYQEERLEHALLHIIKYKEGDRSEAHLAKVAWFCFTQLELERLEKLK